MGLLQWLLQPHSQPSMASLQLLGVAVGHRRLELRQRHGAQPHELSGRHAEAQGQQMRALRLSGSSTCSDEVDSNNGVPMPASHPKLWLEQTRSLVWRQTRPRRCASSSRPGAACTFCPR